MGAYDFVIGIVVGIVLACMSFVLKTSTIHAIRTALPGGVASSTVRRHPIHHHFLQAVGKQIYVMKLAGHLFFGTIAGVENAIRARLHDDAFQSQPIQMLVIDLSKVDGLDYSAAEAFPRINRILRRRNVRLIMCGFSDASETGKSLYNVGLRNGEECISIFDDLNSALEYCENVLLKAFHERRDDLDRTYQPSLRFIGTLHLTRHTSDDLQKYRKPVHQQYQQYRQHRMNHPRSTDHHDEDNCITLLAPRFKSTEIRASNTNGNVTNSLFN